MNRIFLALAIAVYGTSCYAADATNDEVVIVHGSADWSGLYVGASGGWVGVNQNATNSPEPAGFGEPPVVGGGLAGGGFTSTNHDLGADVFGGGLYAGYNWQRTNMVFGAEADLTFFNRDRSDTQTFTDTCCGGSVTPKMTATASNDWLGSVRGRVGYVGGNWLLYATGGLALTETKYSSSLTPDGFAFQNGTNATASESKTSVGGVIGAGLEWLLTNNLVLRTQYDFYFFGGDTISAPVVGQACTGCRFDTKYDDLKIHNVKIGLAYKF